MHLDRLVEQHQAEHFGLFSRKKTHKGSHYFVALIQAGRRINLFGSTGLACNGKSIEARLVPGPLLVLDNISETGSEPLRGLLRYHPPDGIRTLLLHHLVLSL